MECREVINKYEDYRLGRLSPKDFESVAGHIQDCADCFRMDESNSEFVPKGAFVTRETMDREGRK